MDSPKHRIEFEAIRLFAEYGIAGTSVRQIASAAGVADGTLYRHYLSKDELAAELFDRHYGELGLALIGAIRDHDNFSDQIGALLKCAYRLFDTDKPLFSFLLLTQYQLIAQSKPIHPSPVDVVRDLVAGAMARGEIPRRDPEEAAALVLGLALQPATFTVYRRLSGPLSPRANTVRDAALRVLIGDAL